MTKKAKQNKEIDKIKAFLSDWKKRVSSGKLYHIENKQGKKVPFIPNKYQLELYDNLHNYNVIPKARQIGFSTAIDILALDYAIFNKNTAVGIIAHTLDDAKKLFKTKIKFPFDNLGGFDKKTAKYKVGQGIKETIYAVADNRTTLELSNGSSIYVSTSFRSGTLQFLHISEFGKIASKYPEKAKEILSGAVEAVGEGGIIFIESTAEGKNDFYVIVKRAKGLKLLGKKLNHLEPKLFFVAWWQNPDYVLVDEEVVITQETINYFKLMKKEHGVIVKPEQAKWWQSKREGLKELMGREYPTYLEEAFEVIVMGAYYKKEIELLMKEQRFTLAPYVAGYKVYLVGDLGMRDAKDTVFFQLIGKEIRVIKWWRGSDISFADYLSSVVGKLDYGVDEIFLPHDGVKRNENDAGTVYQTCLDAGYKTTVLRKGGINAGIDHARNNFNRMIVNKQDCYQPIKIGGEWIDLSLIDMLGNYKEAFDKIHGIGLGHPEHNDASHTGDQNRYMFQAVSVIEERGQLQEQDVYVPDLDFF